MLVAASYHRSLQFYLTLTHIPKNNRMGFWKEHDLEPTDTKKTIVMQKQNGGLSGFLIHASAKQDLVGTSEDPLMWGFEQLGGGFDALGDQHEYTPGQTIQRCSKLSLFANWTVS